MEPVDNINISEATEQMKPTDTENISENMGGMSLNETEHIHDHQHEGEGHCDCGHSHDKQPQSDKRSDQMIESGKKSSNRSYKKLMKKVQKDPKLQELINYFQQNPNMQVVPKHQMTAKERLRAKLEQQRLRRGGPAVQQAHRERQKELAKKKQTEPKKTEEQKAEDLQNKINNTVSSSIEAAKKQKKSQQNKLKKIQKKYGKISFERYSEALNSLSDSSLSRTEDINREKNIVDLYLKQNPNTTEKHLDIDIIDEELSDDDMEDIEDMEDMEDLEDPQSQ